MKVQLTETAINSAARRAAETRKRVELADKTLPGLRLRVTPAGTRSWVLGMRDREGKPRRFPVGEFPAVGIAEARERARNLRQGVRYDEADPIKQARETRKAAADAAEGIGTLRAILNQYEANAGAALKSWPHSRLRVERVFKAQLDRPAKALTVAELLIAADGYKAQASAACATRTLRPVLKWAAARELVPPGLAALARRDPVRRRTRVLLEAELVKILPALRALKPHAAALRFMLLTLARREEVCAARWAEIDLDAATWTLPGERSKNGQPHIVPLSRQAVALLQAARAGAFNLPKPRRTPPRRRSGSDAPPAPQQWRTPGAADLIFRGKRGEALGNWDRETKAVHAGSQTADWHRHDLRRTGATMLAELGELPDIIEAALNHATIRSPLAATYNRHRYSGQVGAALQRLADRLDQIEAGEAARLDQPQAA